MTKDARLSELAGEALKLAKERSLSIVAAESCTAGKLAALLSEAPGASEHLRGSFVAYTKPNKVAALGLPADMLHSKGAACREVAIAMAKGALARSPADYAVAITGLAGPEPDEDGNPVGLVCLAVASRNGKTVASEKRYRALGRARVQEQAMADALRLLIAAQTGG